MNKIRIIFLVVAVLLVIFFLFFYWDFLDKDANGRYSIAELSSNNTQSRIYIKKKVWGMTNDNQIIVISGTNEKEFVADKSKNYIYEGIMPFFYKLQGDTLSIYTMVASKVPIDLKTNFNIVQIELENPQMMDLIEHDNYKTKELSVIN